MAENHLGAFVLDLQAEQIAFKGNAIPLRPRAWQVLLYLVDRPAVLVSSAELFDHVWAGVAVTPKTLTNVINELRRVLAADPSVRIETRHRRGYQLVIGAPPPSPPDHLQLPEHGAGLLVGRESELEQLASLWEQTRSGARQIVLVGGFAGIGKTSLITAFLERLRPTTAAAALAAKPPILMRGVCMDHRSDPEPYGPVAEALESALTQYDIVPLLRRYAPTWLARMPWLSADEDLALLRQSLIGSGGGRGLREGVRVVEAIAAERPVLLVLEDLHNGDAPTLELVEALAQRDGPASLMIAATHRIEGIPSTSREPLSRIKRLERVDRLTLDALTASSVRAYLQQRLGDESLSDRLTLALERKTGGNPLFLKEVVDAMISRRWLSKDGDRWRLGLAVGDLERLVPDSVREVVGQYAQNLDPESGEVLEVASLVGEEFTDKLLAAACERPVDSVSLICRRLAESDRFIRFVGERLLPDGLPWSAYRFSHSLYRQGIAEQVPAARRRIHHQRIAEQMLREYAACLEEVAPQLAMHFGEAGRWDRQLEYLDRAVGYAMERYAYVDASELLRQAIDVAERQPRTNTDGAVSDAERAAAMRQASRCVAYGLLLLHRNGLGDPLALAAFDRSLEYAEIHQSFALRFRAQMGCCASRAYRGRVDEAVAIASEMIAAADAEHPELVAVACYYGSLAALRSGNYRAATSFGQRTHLALPIASTEVPVNFALEPQSEAVQSHVLTIAGDPRSAAIHRDNAIAALERRSVPYDRAVVFDVLALTAVLADDAAAALVWAERGIEHDSQFGFDGFLTVVKACRAWAICRRGESSVAEYERCLYQRAQTSDLWYQSLLLAYLAELYLRQGDLTRAEATMARIDPEPAYDAEVLRIRGEILRAHGRESEALDCYRAAVRRAEDQGAGLFANRAAASFKASTPAA